jgi:hypothetical protein
VTLRRSAWLHIANRLMVVLEGEVQATNEQFQALSREVKERVGSK